MLWRMQKSALRANLACSARPAKHCKPLTIVPRASATSDGATKSDKKEEVKEKKEPTFHPKVSSKDVAMFLTTLVEETEIVEVHLEVGSFELKVKRSTAGASSAHQAAAAPAAAAPAAVAAAPSPAAPAAAPLESVDESVVQVSSPKVGIFRRGKYAAGKRVGNGNTVNEGDQVKRGQALGFIEQLGTYFPLEAPQAGEVLKFRTNDGEPVEYQQLIVDLAPFFGGHIIGDKKHA